MKVSENSIRRPIGGSPSSSTPEIVFGGISDSGTGWLVTFTYRVNNHDWLTAKIPVSKSVADEEIVAYARHCLNGLCATIVEKTEAWKMSKEDVERLTGADF